MTKKSFLLLIMIGVSYTNNYAQVNTERYRVDSDSLGFSLRADLEYFFMTGNSDFHFFGANTRFNQKWTEDYLFLVANTGFGQNSGKSFLNQTLVHLRYVYSVSNKIQVEGFMQYDNNHERLLNHRYLIGAGVRMLLVKKEAYLLRLGFSGFYEQEQFELPASARHSPETETFRLNSYLTYDLDIKKDISLLIVLYAQPSVKDFSDYRIVSDNALSVNLWHGLEMLAKINVRYDSAPPDEIKDFDLVTNLGLGISL